MPTWDLHGSWGNPEVYWRALQYVRSVWPFWNRTGGADQPHAGRGCLRSPGSSRSDADALFAANYILCHAPLCNIVFNNSLRGSLMRMSQLLGLDVVFAIFVLL